MIIEMKKLSDLLESASALHKDWFDQVFHSLLCQFVFLKKTKYNFIKSFYNPHSLILFSNPIPVFFWNIFI